jgi:hypothetical protein
MDVLLPSLALKIVAVNLYKATRRHIKNVILQGLESVRDLEAPIQIINHSTRYLLIFGKVTVSIFRVN